MSNHSIQEEIANIEAAIAAQEALRGTLPDAQIEATLAQLRQKKAELTAQLAAAPGTTVVGARGVHVGGNVGGSIITGDKNTLTQVGGDFVKGDKVGGDKVGGDKISVGDIIGSTGVAIGRKAQAHVEQGISGADLAALFQAIYQKVEARPADPDVDKEEIVAQVQQIEAEVTTQEQPNEKKLERWLHNLASMAPDIVDVMAASLAGPVAAGATIFKKIVDKVKHESAA